jgi:Tfp pilus assembly protein PilV
VARRTSSINRKGARHSAFTLAECLVASVVLVAAVAGTIAPLCASQQQTYIMQERATALSLSRELMEEICSRPFTKPTGSTELGWSGGQTNRSLFDCVGDYSSYNDSTAAMTTATGSSLGFGSNVGTFTRAVTVKLNADPSCSTGASSDFALVTVTVTTPDGDPISVQRLMTLGVVKW